MASTKTNQTEEIFEMKSDISLLKRDVLLFGEYFKRIDGGMEKVGELTNSMHTMIRLHEERITQQMQEDNSLKALVEQRRLETMQGFEKVAEAMEARRIETRDGIQKITEAVESLKADLTAKIDAHGSSIKSWLSFKTVVIAVGTLLLSGLFSGSISAIFKKLIP